MSTREAVLSALRSAGPIGVGGEGLASQLGVSRVAISKHVGVLRGLGYTIEASPLSGYRLTAVPDLCLPTEVGPLLGEAFWVAVEGGLETASTNADARERAVAGAPEGTVVLAAAQRTGRGRLGRSWESPQGGVYASAILRPALAPAQVGPLALVVSVGLARGLAGLGLDVGLKWPNDVWSDGRKLAGVLLEMTAEDDRVVWIVAGVGINVRRAARGRPDAACVRDGLPGVPVPVVAAAVLDGVARAYQEWLATGFNGIAAEFEALSVLTGRSVTVRDAMGAVRAQGCVVGIEAEGRLLLRGDTGDVQAVVAGEVTLRE